MMLKPYDDNNTTVDSDDDNYETPPELFFRLTNLYNVTPKLDACATRENTKCSYFLTDALHQEWKVGNKIVPIWVNAPGTLQLKMVERADFQHLRYGMDIIMILPANCMSTDVWHRYIEGKREYHAVKGRPIFLKNGKKSKFPSRNSYVCVLWKKRNG